MLDRISRLPECGQNTKELATDIDVLLARRAKLTAGINAEIAQARVRLRDRVVKYWTVEERIQANIGSL